MKGSNVSAVDRRLHDRMASEVGCIACRKDGRINHHVSIHHIDGRTKQHAHRNVLPLCAGHHQQNTGAQGLIAVHPYKAQFERLYGRQEHLLVECMELLSTH